MAGIVRDKEGLKCPNCGRIDYVLEYFKAWVCFEAAPQEDGGWHYRRREELYPGYSFEYECPICRETYHYIEIVES